MTKWQTKSMICVPLKSKRRVLAVIQLINSPWRASRERDVLSARAVRLAAIAIDNARADEKIQELTITDDCTGLYNARHLYKTLEASSTARNASPTRFSVCFLDLGPLQAGNDVHGHLIGSRLLSDIDIASKAACD